MYEMLSRDAGPGSDPGPVGLGQVLVLAVEKMAPISTVEDPTRDAGHRKVMPVSSQFGPKFINLV